MVRLFKVVVRAVACSVVVLAFDATTVLAANQFAVVNANGTLVYGNGGPSVTKLGIGQYEVTFASNVSACAYLATPVNAFSQAIQVFTAGGHLSPNGVFLEVKNQGGGLMDGPFHLAVVCAAPKISYAVVDYAGNLDRATTGTTINHLSPGRYQITFPTNVKTCAYVATVGDPDNNLVFSPAGVYTGSGSTSRDVYVETKNPGGGLSDSIPFHLAAVCLNAQKTHGVVITPSGIPHRASNLSSSFRSGVGTYVTAHGVSLAQNCATIATRGSVDKSVPFTPATVELTPMATPNLMMFTVEDLLFFGGNPIDQAIHTVSFCK